MFPLNSQRTMTGKYTDRLLLSIAGRPTSNRVQVLHSTTIDSIIIAVLLQNVSIYTDTMMAPNERKFLENSEIPRPTGLPPSSPAAPGASLSEGGRKRLTKNPETSVRKSNLSSKQSRKRRTGQARANSYIQHTTKYIQYTV